jgi:hypothetical protein
MGGGVKVPIAATIKIKSDAARVGIFHKRVIIFFVMRRVRNVKTAVLAQLAKARIVVNTNTTGVRTLYAKYQNRDYYRSKKFSHDSYLSGKINKL